LVGLQWGRIRVRSEDLTLVQFSSADVSILLQNSIADFVTS